MGVYRSVSGQVRVQVTSADITGFLDRLTVKGLTVRDMEVDGSLDISFAVDRRDLPLLREICERQGSTLKIQRRIGVYWTLRAMGARPVLFFGGLFLLVLLFWVPSRVLFVEVEGNCTVPTRQILVAAEENGICFGVSGRSIRSETVKNGILEAIPELKWVGVNTRGCVAVISVREVTWEPTELPRDGISSIVSCADGVILTATATSGNMLCKPGQVVQKGQILISGYTDSGVALRGLHAEGEIYARTIRNLTVVSLGESSRITGICREVSAYSVILGKKRINLWKGSGKTGVTCGRMYTEYYITLPGGFRLPIVLAKDTTLLYDTEVMQSAPEDRMMDFAGDYLLTQLIAGKILDSRKKVSWEETLCRMEVMFHCTEMIGRHKAEEIGDLHG